MADLGNFDATTVDPASDFQPLPDGVYRVMITESEVKPTKAGTRAYLQLRMVLAGNEQYDGRVMFHRLNLKNPNETAVQIAHRELSSICHAVDVLKPGDSEKLHNIPFCIRVGMEKRKDNGELTNRIKGFMKAGVNGGSDAADAGKGTSSTPGNADWMSK